MPLRKEMTATAVANTLIVPLQRLSIAEASNLSPASQPIPVRVWETINDAIVPKLRSGWAARVLPYFGRQLTPVELHRLEAALTLYVQGRVASTNPIFWDDFERRLRRLAEISRALLDEFDEQPPAYTLAWSMIVESSADLTGNRLDRDDLYPLISGLHGASLHALEGARRRREDGVTGDYSAPWTALIHTLAKLFERAGGKVTAPKGHRDGGYAKPSPFVQLVWAVIHEAIPEKLREHNQSQGAIAGAISDALSKRRMQA